MKQIKTIALILSISTSLFCVALTTWGNFKHGGVITLDTFIGVMATFIGVCAAIIVGFQIISLLEFYKTKEEMQKLKISYENKYKELEHMQLKLEEEFYLARNGVSSAFRVLYRLNRNHPLSSIAYIISIITYDPIKNDEHTPDIYQAYCKLDYLLDNSISKSPTTLKNVIKRYLPYIQNANIPDWIENYNDVIKVRKRIISKIELL